MTPGRGPGPCIVVRSTPEDCGAEACGKVLFTLIREGGAPLPAGLSLQRECPRRKSRLCTLRLDRLFTR